jgi:DNA-directed RNA polymerase specialized sigma24 family protein
MRKFSAPARLSATSTSHPSLRMQGQGCHPAESELIARAKAGDRDAFGELYARHHRQILAFALRRLHGDLPAAEDLASETFLSAFCRIRSLRGGVPFRTWLESLTQFKLICQRHQARQTPLIDDVRRGRAA